MKLTPVLAILCVAGVWSDWSDGSDAQAATANDDRVFHVEDAGRIYYKLVAINSTATWRFRTSQATGGLDTVLHVWNRSTGAWIRSNDDVAGGNCTDLFPTSELTSCRDLNLTSGTTVIVFVHRRSNATSGTCLFEAGVKNGTPVVSETIEPGGDITRRWTISDPIEWEAGDKLQLAYTAAHPRPNEDIWTHGMLLPGVLALAGTEKLYGYALSATAPFGDPSVNAGIWGQAALPLAASSSSMTPYPNETFAFGYVVGHSYWDTTLYGNGTVTLYRNDAGISGRDPDHDYLGTELEIALGTCWEDTECPDGNPKDTDGDGLRDDWETVGGCTFYGCEAHTSDAINLAYYGGDPLIQNAFLQVDWPQIGEAEVDVFGRLAPTLAQVVDAYWSDTATTGVTKSPIKLFFDYGQLAQGGTGGNIGPENPNFCYSIEPREDCVEDWQPCMEWPSAPPGSCEGYCGEQSPEDCFCDEFCPYMGDCCADVCQHCPTVCEVQACAYGLVCEQSGDGGAPVCVTPECRRVCDRSELAHLDHFDQSATFTPYNLQHVLRGDPTLPHVFVPRNRRGVFGEVWLNTVFEGEGAYIANHGFKADSSCCVLTEDCSDLRPGCVHLFPGWVALYQGHFVYGSPHSLAFSPLLVFHEVGHFFGLLHGWIDTSPQAECVFDHDCPPTYPDCRGGVCVRDVVNVPNYISLMTYNFMKVPGIDLDGRLDYSSGIRPSLQGFRDRGVACEDQACPTKQSSSCPIPEYAWSWVEGDACCLEGICVEAALDEALGIGDFFALPAAPEEAAALYIANRNYQLKELSGCLSNGLDFNNGIGPVPVFWNQARHEIDWDQDESLDSWLVGAFLFEKDLGCGPWPGMSDFTVGQFNTGSYHDFNEWEMIRHSGFRHFGLNQQPALSLSPVCGEAEGIECPEGFQCDFGRCSLDTEGYWPPGVPPP